MSIELKLENSNTWTFRNSAILFLKEPLSQKAFNKFQNSPQVKELSDYFFISHVDSSNEKNEIVIDYLIFNKRQGYYNCKNFLEKFQNFIKFLNSYSAYPIEWEIFLEFRYSTPVLINLDADGGISLSDGVIIYPEVNLYLKD